MQINTFRKNATRVVTLVKYLLFCSIIFLAWSIFTYSMAYFNPDFNQGFLIDKYAFFDGSYKYGLYAHCISAPIVILLSSCLIFFRLENYRPRLHRTLGKLVAIITYTVFIPSSFILAEHALGGNIGKCLFYILSVITTLCLSSALYFIRRGNRLLHQQWMQRFYLMLLSGILLRINQFIAHYFFQTSGENSYLWAAFLSWFPSLLLHQLYIFRSKRKSVK